MTVNHYRASFLTFSGNVYSFIIIHFIHGYSFLGSIGLVRSGVAPDHPEVKQVTNDFEQVATDSRFQFLGNVSVGKDITVPQLLSNYHAVVLAYGAASDRTMGIPGEELNNVFSARAFVNWYNGHPDFRNFKPNLDTEDIVIVGQGNVAIDCARILTKTQKELCETDISTYALEALSKSKVKRVHVVGRRGHVQAAFTMKELREITRLDDAQCIVHTEELNRGRTDASKKEMDTQRARKRMDALLTEVATAAATPDTKKSKQLLLRFLLSPTKVLPDSQNSQNVGAVEMDVTTLSGDAESQSAKATGTKETIKAGMVLRSIGYKSVALPDVPFDTKRSVVRNAKGRVTKEDGNAVAGLYCTGWLKRGPSGIIGTNITDARETVSCMLEDKTAGKLPTNISTNNKALDNVIGIITKNGKSNTQLIPWKAWNKIDAQELARGKALGKSREKFTVIDEMIKIGHTA